MEHKSLSEHHLACSQHAAPPAVGGQGGGGQRGELLPVGEPNSGREILAESLHVSHDRVSIGGFVAGVRRAFVVWGKEATCEAFRGRGSLFLSILCPMALIKLFLL